jgi:hypothetical protein
MVTKTKSSATHTKDLGRKLSLMLPDFEEKISEIVIFRQQVLYVAKIRQIFKKIDFTL